MRVAVISDIHGNAIAFDAVLADIGRHAVDRLVCLGDAIQGGAEPVECVARLRELACPVVMGNADAWLLTGQETGAEEPPNPWLVTVREWSLSRLSEADRRLIEGFQPTVEIPLPAGKTLLCAHGTPRSFDDAIFPETPAEQVWGWLGEHLPAILCGGHTHVQQIRQLGASFFFNPGSVGLPFRRDSPEDRPTCNRWAEYAVLTVDEDGRTALEFRQVPYDVERLIALILASDMPEPATLARRYRPLTDSTARRS